MAYTRLWDETQPPGTALANTLSTLIQNPKTDIRERLAGIFGLSSVQWAADPIVPISLTLTGALTAGSVVGNVTGNLTGTVLTPAQANITSLGTLTGLVVTGIAGQALVVNGVSGQYTTKIQANTGVGNSYGLLIQAGTNASDAALQIVNATNTVGLLTVTGAGVVSAPTGGFTGTLNTAAQPNITSLGTLISVLSISKNGQAINISPVTNTSFTYIQLQNLTGSALLAVESSVGGSFFSNSIPYATLVGSNLATALQFATNNIVRQTIDSAGNVTFTNSITAPTFIGNLTGTILTAAQGNITSLGTLAGLTVNGPTTLAGGSLQLLIQAAAGVGAAYLQIMGGAASGHYNWVIEKSQTVASWLQIAYSTAVDANTFIAPVFHFTNGSQFLVGTTSIVGVTAGGIHAAGASVFDSTLNVTGQITGQNNSIIAGSAGDYPFFGYNFTRTAGAGVYNYTVTDFASAIQFVSGGLSFKTAPSGVAGNPITWTERLAIAQGGAVTANGAWTFNSTVSGITTLTATTVNANLTGTILTATQANITSLGTLTALSVSGTADHGTGHISAGTSNSVTAATTIYTVPANAATVVIVFGSDGTNAFVDLVMVGSNSATVTVISQHTITAAPATRTYTIPSGLLKLAMGSGTYTVKTMPLYTL